MAAYESWDDGRCGWRALLACKRMLGCQEPLALAARDGWEPRTYAWCNARVPMIGSQTV